MKKIMLIIVVVVMSLSCFSQEIKNDNYLKTDYKYDEETGEWKETKVPYKIIRSTNTEKFKNSGDAYDDAVNQLKKNVSLMIISEMKQFMLQQKMSVNDTIRDLLFESFENSSQLTCPPMEINSEKITQKPNGDYSVEIIALMRYDKYQDLIENPESYKISPNYDLTDEQMNEYNELKEQLMLITEN